MKNLIDHHNHRTTTTGRLTTASTTQPVPERQPTGQLQRGTTGDGLRVIYGGRSSVRGLST